MKGGFNNPPNEIRNRQPYAAYVPSMKGGFNNPPNNPKIPAGYSRTGPSMKGGFNNPPNAAPQRAMSRQFCPFNEGGVQ